MTKHQENQQDVLSVIIPIYNEEKNLRDLLDYFFSSPCPVPREWILIDDASTDRTKEILKELKSTFSFELIEQPSNQGKGAAVAEGVRRASGTLIVIQDADFEYDPHDIPLLIEPLLRGEADVVFGSRFKRSSTQVHRTYHFFVNHFLTWLSNLFSGVYLTDMETCYKVFRADLAKAMVLKSKRFGIEIELTAYVAKSAARMFELPIRYYPRTRLQGKKIGWKDGLAALVHLVRFNFFTNLSDAFQNLPRRYDPSHARTMIRRPPTA